MLIFILHPSLNRKQHLWIQSCIENQNFRVALSRILFSVKRKLVLFNFLVFFVSTSSWWTSRFMYDDWRFNKRLQNLYSFWFLERKLCERRGVKLTSLFVDIKSVHVVWLILDLLYFIWTFINLINERVVVERFDWYITQGRFAPLFYLLLSTLNLTYFSFFSFWSYIRGSWFFFLLLNIQYSLASL